MSKISLSEELKELEEKYGKGIISVKDNCKNDKSFNIKLDRGRFGVIYESSEPSERDYLIKAIDGRYECALMMKEISMHNEIFTNLQVYGDSSRYGVPKIVSYCKNYGKFGGEMYRCFFKMERVYV